MFMDMDKGYETIKHTMKKGDEIYEGAYHEDDVKDYATLLKTCLDFALPEIQRFLDDYKQTLPDADEPAEAAEVPEPSARRRKRAAAAESRHRKKD